MVEREEQPEQQRLTFPDRRGWYQFGRIPYKIYLNFDTPDTDTKSARFDLNKKIPGRYLLTPDRGRPVGSHSVSVFIHESVPKEFEDIVAFHELRESELVFADGIHQSEAHTQAEKETSEYAQKYLTSEDFERFTKWYKALYE